jgi:hypothetical protein
VSRYGGIIERTVLIEPSAAEQRMREVHLLSFPSQEAFEQYRTDAELAELASLRLSCIAHTEILFGQEGPDYSSGPASQEPLR